MKIKKNEPEINIGKEQLKKIFLEYKFDDVDRYMEYDDEQYEFIQSFEKLNDVDKIIIALYAEFQSQRKVANLLNVSRTTIIKSLNNIRRKIFQNICY